MQLANKVLFCDVVKHGAPTFEKVCVLEKRKQIKLKKYKYKLLTLGTLKRESFLCSFFSKHPLTAQRLIIKDKSLTERTGIQLMNDVPKSMKHGMKNG